MQKLFVLSRARDGRRVEFYSDRRAGKTVFVIREVSANSQDSVTADPAMMEGFRNDLLNEGFFEVSF